MEIARRKKDYGAIPRAGDDAPVTHWTLAPDLTVVGLLPAWCPTRYSLCNSLLQFVRASPPEPSSAAALGALCNGRQVGHQGVQA